MDLKPGQKVLDVGCGIGGGDFYMAENFDVHVVGIDLSVNMISFALERAIGLKCSVEFEVADCTTKIYPDNSFDVIYSRDTILHIQVSKAKLLKTSHLLFFTLEDAFWVIYHLYHLSLFRTSQLYSEHSSSGLNQAVKFSSATIAEMLRNRLLNSQST